MRQATQYTIPSQLKRLFGNDYVASSRSPIVSGDATRIASLRPQLPNERRVLVDICFKQGWRYCISVANTDTKHGFTLWIGPSKMATVLALRVAYETRRGTINLYSTSQFPILGFRNPSNSMGYVLGGSLSLSQQLMHANSCGDLFLADVVESKHVEVLFIC
ncbi:hypothetical protein IC617_08310 [Neiella sp. HB171785]|uniref:Uncharacterized protein n=1 Tax=Neiella litorisoli TaxID=2771431 RepID=A0A8J6QIQ7_9GAMM|nr:hypothetical protein [Neiella litorisoli]MBD1389427.1 hypothetical protein [Neiella litorisoli]